MPVVVVSQVPFVCGWAVRLPRVVLPPTGRCLLLRETLTHSPRQFCSPTRGSFLSGRYPFRLGNTRSNFIRRCRGQQWRSRPVLLMLLDYAKQCRVAGGVVRSR